LRESGGDAAALVQDTRLTFLRAFSAGPHPGRACGRGVAMTAPGSHDLRRIDVSVRW
jgi:hypothetical protein